MRCATHSKRWQPGSRSTLPSSLGSYAIDSASSTAFIYYADLNGDGLKEKIRYFLSGTTLRQGVIKPSGSPLVYNPANEKIADMIHGIVKNSGPIFTYYDTNYDGTTAPLATPVNLLNIRLVKITVKVDVDPRKPPGPAQFTTQVSIRNLKDNY